MALGALLLVGAAGGSAPGPGRPPVETLESAAATANLTVAIVASAIGGVAPLTVGFVAEVSGAVGSSPTVTWAFGDGGGGTGLRLNYTYERSGDFTARATAEDGADRFANASIGISVTGPDGNGSAPDGPAALPAYVVAAAAIAVGVAVGAIGYRTVAGRRSGTVPASVPRPPEDPPSTAGTPERASSPGAPASRGAPDPTASVAPVPPSKPLLPAEPPGVTLPVTPAEERRRLSERVITHLLWYGRPTTEGIARAEATQQGMARLLDAGQNSVSKVLLRLEAAGIVKVQTEHVPGAPRRVKTYTLTARGEAVARAIERASGRRGPSN